MILALIGALLTPAHQAPVGAQSPTVDATTWQPSVITVHARGRKGTERLALEVNGQTLARWQASATGAVHRHIVTGTGTEAITVDSIRVRNDTGRGWPEAVIVDRIEMDGQVFQSEADGNRSSGSWTADTGCSAGFKVSEWLQCDHGWLEYTEAAGTVLRGSEAPPDHVNPLADPPADPLPDPPVTGDDDTAAATIEVHARGRTGDEVMALWLNGQEVARWAGVGETDRGYEYLVKQPTIISSLEVGLIGGGWPQALIVDRVTAAGVDHHSEAPSTTSVGSWTAETGCAAGAKGSEWLQCGDGRFRYASANGERLGTPHDDPPSIPVDPTPDEPTAAGEIVIRAEGSQGTEEMALEINGETVKRWSVTAEPADYRYRPNRAATIETLRVHFTNDGGWPHADRNLIVDHLDIGQQRFLSSDPSTRSSGSWDRAGGCAAGQKSSRWLHCRDAWFEYPPVVGLVVGPGATPDSDDPPPSTTPGRLLVMSKSSVFRHPSIDDGTAMLQAMAAEQGWDVTFSSDSAIFTETDVADRFDAVVFLNTDSVVFDNEVEKQAFRAFIEAGRGFVGIHGAAATHWRLDRWPWYRSLVGQRFIDHPLGGRQEAVVTVTDPSHPSTAHLPRRWTVRDEWYNFDAGTGPFPPHLTVLATVDETTYSGGTMGSHHPVVWTHVFGPGRSRVWYTNLGHEPALFTDQHYVDHVRGGIAWVLGPVE